MQAIFSGLASNAFGSQAPAGLSERKPSIATASYLWLASQASFEAQDHLCPRKVVRVAFIDAEQPVVGLRLGRASEADEAVSGQNIAFDRGRLATSMQKSIS